MRTISLWQIWASLIAIGAKKIETRSWPTTYRGPIAIHAAKYRGELDSYHLSPFRECLQAAGIMRVADLPLGAVLCVATLADCVPTEKVVKTISEQERAFGNYQPGRWAWIFSKVEVFEQPIPAKGMQGIWSWPMPKDAKMKEVQL